MVLYALVVASTHKTYSPEATGGRVSALRRSARYSQAALAAKMSERGFPWHQNTVCRIEAGQRRVTLEEGAELARIFSVPLSDLGLAA
jgi:transcriptional regulator with XRE-family HTH domain